MAKTSLTLKNKNNPEVSAKFKRDLDAQKYITNAVVFILVAILIAAIFTLGGIVTSAWASKQASYENLQDQVQEQNHKIDQLTKNLEAVRK